MNTIDQQRGFNPSRLERDPPRRTYGKKRNPGSAYPAKRMVGTAHDFGPENYTSLNKRRKVDRAQTSQPEVAEIVSLEPDPHGHGRESSGTQHSAMMSTYFRPHPRADALRNGNRLSEFQVSDKTLNPSRKKRRKVDGTGSTPSASPSYGAQAAASSGSSSPEIIHSAATHANLGESSTALDKFKNGELTGLDGDKDDLLMDPFAAEAQDVYRGASTPVPPRKRPPSPLEFDPIPESAVKRPQKAAEKGADSSADELTSLPPQSASRPKLALAKHTPHNSKPVDITSPCKANGRRVPSYALAMARSHAMATTMDPTLNLTFGPDPSNRLYIRRRDQQREDAQEVLGVVELRKAQKVYMDNQRRMRIVGPTQEEIRCRYNFDLEFVEPLEFCNFRGWLKSTVDSTVKLFNKEA